MKFTLSDGTKVIAQPAKSVIRYAWVRMKQEGAVKLADKKRVFAETLNNSGIRDWTKNYMIKKANSMRSNAAFDQYLVNSELQGC